MCELPFISLKEQIELKMDDQNPSTRKSLGFYPPAVNTSRLSLEQIALIVVMSVF